MKLFLLVCISALLLIFFPTPIKAESCDYSNDYDFGNYDIPTASYDGRYFYDPGYYDSQGYDNWFYQTILNRDTEYETIRFIENNYQDNYCDNGYYDDNIPPSCDYPTTDYNSYNQPDYYGRYDNRPTPYPYTTSGYYDRDIWDRSYGSGNYYSDQYDYGYNNCDLQNNVPTNYDKFQDHGFDGWYRDSSGERTIRCVTYEMYYEHEYASSQPNDDYLICRAR